MAKVDFGYGKSGEGEYPLRCLGQREAVQFKCKAFASSLIPYTPRLALTPLRFFTQPRAYSSPLHYPASRLILLRFFTRPCAPPCASRHRSISVIFCFDLFTLYSWVWIVILNIYGDNLFRMGADAHPGMITGVGASI